MFSLFYVGVAVICGVMCKKAEMEMRNMEELTGKLRDHNNVRKLIIKGDR